MHTDDFRQLPCQLLPGKSNQIRSWDHGDIVQDEVPQMELWPDEMHDDRRRHKRPESIDCHRYVTRGSKANPQEVPWVYPRPSTFAIWLNTPCNLVPVMVEDWHMGVVGRLLLLPVG